MATSKKSRFALYGPIKDEPFLKEWILYYKKLGVDLFIILDDYSKTTVKNCFDELNIKNYEIIIHDKSNWDYDKMCRNFKDSYTRTKVFEDHILPICKKHNIDYLMHFDADEFLYLNKFENIQEMVNHYEPFDELNINWLIYYDECKKEIKNNSLIKSSSTSGKYLNFYTKSITKVDSILSGWHAHNTTLKKESIRKNILNDEIKNNYVCGTVFKTNEYNEFHFSYEEAPVFIAHYVFKSIKMYVEKKFINIDGNFNAYFNFNDETLLETKKKLVNYNKENKNDLIEYIYFLRKKNKDEVEKLEQKHEFFKKYKKNYLKYLTFYGCDLKNKLPNGEDYYKKNTLLIDNYNISY
jgi:hypothetical protein